MSPFAVHAEIVPERTDFERFSLDAVESAPTRRGIAIWRLLRANRRFPAHDDLELRDVADILPYMSLVAVIEGGEDFENRFVGDAVVRAHDVPIRHRRFSDVAKDMPTLMEGLLPLFRKVVSRSEQYIRIRDPREVGGSHDLLRGRRSDDLAVGTRLRFAL